MVIPGNWTVTRFTEAEAMSRWPGLKGLWQQKERVKGTTRIARKCSFSDAQKNDSRGGRRSGACS
jgi:hypothetical protein